MSASECGGEKYAELLSLAYRQVCAAHKLVCDGDGNLLYISKECFSNGCAATVDVSYPSVPMFLLYNPELVEGMMRPVFKFARSDGWIFDFAPHDAGCYPHLNGQVYAGCKPENQMPVEECGNMLIMSAAVAVAEGTPAFASENLSLLENWEIYLERFGRDPANQLCTDDFAGHLAHNCNLSIKAIMGVAALGLIYKMLGREDEGNSKLSLAREMASDFACRASNGDGSLRLAFDRPGTFSMKYNAVWDKLWGTNIFGRETLENELKAYPSHTNKYGLPLDNRADYTKSDWLVWTAALLDSKEDFEAAVAPLWLAYHESESRVPMTDWYDTVSAAKVGFQHRTVQGGLFIRLLDASGKMRVS
ncbi:MAG: glutaminase domain-containing protein [Eubacteriales bacterium]